jgi:hypothetical protein
MDFTIKQYKKLTITLQSQGYFFQTFREFIKKPIVKTIILRHDVDRLPQNSLQTAKIENDLGIKGSYYFRAVPESWDEDIIKRIASLGHEIGYHYENLTTSNGNISKAIEDFTTNLDKLRQLASITTICMHGSPRSKLDNKDIWKKYNYHDFGIIGEPYFDIDFSKVLYLTDTGRMWDGYKVSVRDKIEGHQDRWNKEGLRFHSTNDIISGIKKLPDQIMFTVHSQRWYDKSFPWLKELVWQNAKNVGKRVLKQVRK